MDPGDHLQVVTFRLTDLDPAAYEAHCTALAPAFAELPGLRAKAWLADPSTGTYGGVYAWDGRDAMDAYVHGPVFGALLANPAMADVTTRDFRVLEGPTRITRRR